MVNFNNVIKFNLPVLILLMCASHAFTQRLVDWNKGDHNETRKGFMDGNLVGTVYYNHGEVADWQNWPTESGVWPKGSDPVHTYVDGVAIIVQAEAVDPQGNFIHPLETNYYEFTRYDRSTGVTYGWWPLPGYANPVPSGPPARSDRPETWPARWPDLTSEWAGKWNGFFGPDVKNADVETYFVFDDNEDREYIINNNFYPDADDPSRGGLGMQVRARGFQWSQVLAADVIFWFYEITNMSTTDYDKTLFAQYVDWGIGGHDNSSNNAGDYNDLLDISYAWSTVPYGSPGNWSPVGVAGYAFLESPGVPDDFRDNDTDGLTDEKRDNNAVRFFSQPEDDPFIRDVLTDTTDFRDFYGYSWRPHWDADENADWRNFLDLNENRKWDEGEALNDDVGADGLGPFDDAYPGPDIDGTEANGRPDQGEPNFGVLDKDESDQLGLTGFLIFPVHIPYELKNDEQNWEALSQLPEPHGKELTGVNLANFFSSYLFNLNGRNTYGKETGETERFSMALIFGIDKEDVFRRKKTVQQIYNANYQFAKPPDKAIVKAVPGDGRVTLYWGDRSEKTFDEFYQRYNFEGYRIYRSTEPNFLENRVITDAYGKATYQKPIAQFDLIDGLKGPHPIDVNGAMFNLGNDTGLEHSFIDSSVQNGQTYYYAVVAYDQGYTTTTVEQEFVGIPPSETTATIRVDNVTGEIETDINTAVVTPRAPTAGYISPKIEDLTHSGPGTGSIIINILDPDSLKDNHVHRLEFQDFTTYHDNSYPSYMLIDYSAKDTLIKLTPLESDNERTIVTSGFDLQIKNDPSVRPIDSQTGWKVRSTTYAVLPGFDTRYQSGYSSKRINYPADFEITFTEKGQGDISMQATDFSKPIPSNVVIKNLTDNVDNVQFIFRDLAGDSVFNIANPDTVENIVMGDAIFIVVGDSTGLKADSYKKAHITWSITAYKDVTIPDSLQVEPQPGDVYYLATSKPFRTGEYYEFTVKSPGYDKAKATADLDQIAVVPNPYVGAASWEPATNTIGRGERLVQFIHLPEKCTIRIYTMSGHLVQTLYHESTVSDGQEPWNLVSRDGMNIAYGMYVYHVDAPGIGKKIGRFGVIK
ncbi:hypothetical protein JW960_09870 [candidate division KSB1 bacterium]|nr:hypothetical protein [candidate division KSB1 bacterium]